LCTILPLAAIAIATAEAASRPATTPATPTVRPFPGKLIRNIDQSGVKEPSGIVYHPIRKTLFVVGDAGDIVEMKTDGTPVRRRAWKHGNFEGITCHPMTGRLYVAVERKETILEVDPDGLKITRTFPIERTFAGRTVLKPGKHGIEGITFIPGSKPPQTERFWLSFQSFYPRTDESPSAIFAVVLPSSAGPADEPPVKIDRYRPMTVTDLSDLCYNAARDRLYILSKTYRLILEMNRQGQIETAWELPGQDVEGLAIDPDGFWYFAQDLGGIMKYQVELTPTTVTPHRIPSDPP